MFKCCLRQISRKFVIKFRLNYTKFKKNNKFCRYIFRFYIPETSPGLRQISREFVIKFWLNYIKFKKNNKFYRYIVRSSIPEPSHGLGYAIYSLCDIFYPSLVPLCRPIYGSPYSGIQKSYLVKYGILGFGIGNKTQGIWIPLTAGIQNPIKQVPLTKNPESSTWNPE